MDEKKLLSWRMVSKAIVVEDICFHKPMTKQEAIDEYLKDGKFIIEDNYIKDINEIVEAT